MQMLLDCRSCSGFIPPGAGACPCCGAAVVEPPRAKAEARSRKGRAPATSGRFAAAFGLAATGLMAVSLMACYGLPMCDESAKVDEDKDGYFADPGNCYIEEPDCNDGDKTIHPGADDTAGDGIDQNCDGQDGIATSTGGAGGTGTTSSGGTGGTGGTGGMTGGAGGTTTTTTTM